MGTYVTSLSPFSKLKNNHLTSPRQYNNFKLKHKFQFQGKSSWLWSLHTGIICFWFVKIKCRYHCSKTDHVHSFHLYWLYVENFIFELSEKIRFQFRASKINLQLWLLAYMIYMVGFVRKNGITFMFTFSILVERWGSCRLSGWGVRLKMKFRSWTWFVTCIYCFILINGCIATPMVRQRAGDQEGVGSTPSALPFVIFILFFHFFASLQRLGPVLGFPSFLLSLTPCSIFTPPWFSLHILFLFYFLYYLYYYY